MLTLILLIAALAAFILAACNVGGVNWIALGLCFVVTSWILPLIGITA